MSDRVDEIAAVYGVSRRELTVGQIEDYFLSQLEEEVLKKGNLWKGSYNPNNKNINNPVHKESEDRGVVGGKEGNFRKPTVEDIKAYCLERKNSVNAEQFFDYYESKGWCIGRNGRMKDWKAAVRTWERNKISNGSTPKPKSKGFSNFEERNTDYDALFGGR